MAGVVAPDVDHRPRPVEAALWVLASSAVIGSLVGLIRTVSEEGLPVFMIVFFRNLIGLTIMIPFAIRIGFGRLGRRKMLLYSMRGIFDVVAMTCWFTAITLLPLAQVVSLTFTMPFWATLGAALILGEIVRIRRWSATVIGFVGAMIIVQPWQADLSVYIALPLISSGFAAAAMLTVKALSSDEPSERIVFFMMVYLTPITFLLALNDWVWPDLRQIGMLALVGCCGNLAHYCMAQGFARADASALMPFTYAQLPVAAAIGWYAFGQTVPVETWAGAAIIAAAAIYIARREAQIAAEAERAVTRKTPQPTS